MASRVTLQEGMSLAKGKFKFVKSQPQILSDEQARQFENDSRFVVRKLEPAGKKKAGAGKPAKGAKNKKGKGKNK